MAEEIGALKIGLSIDSAKFDKSMASVDRNLKALGGEMAIIRAKGKDWGNSLEGLGSKQKTLSTILESQDVKVKKLNDSYQKAVAEQGANSKAAENLAVKLNKATAEMTKTETELGQVTAELKRQEAELKDNRTAWDKTADSMSKTGDKLQAFGDKAKTTGKGLSLGLTAPILAVGTASTKMAIDQDAAFAKVSTLLVGSEADFKKYKKSITKASSELGVAFDEYSEAVYGSISAGVEQGKAVEFAGKMAKLAKGGFTDMATATDVVTTAINAYGLSIDDTDEIMDQLINTQNLGKTTVAELAESMGKVIPVAQSQGVAFDQLSAGYAVLTKNGVATAEAGTYMKAMFGELGKAGSKVDKILREKTGKSFSELQKEGKNTGDVLAILQEEASNSGLKLSDMFGSMEAGSASLVLSKNGGAEFNEILKTMGGAAGSTDEAFKKMNDTAGEKTKKAFNSLKNAGAEFGDVILPVLVDVAEKGTELIAKFDELEPAVKKNIVVAAGLAAAIGPVVLVGGHLAASIGTILKVASPLISVIGNAGLAGSFAALVSPIGLTVAGLGLLTAAVGLGVKAYKDSNEVNIEALETKQKEIEKNDKLIESYEGLRSKNQLSNEQMLRYLDIQAEIQKTTAADKIAALKDEQARLLEKSTLTNEQMDEFLKLNDDVIKTAPNTVKAISSEGEAFALNTIALKELNVEKAKELEAHARDTLKKSLENEAKLITEMNKLKTDRVELEAKTQSKILEISKTTQAIKNKEDEILALEKEKIGASLEQIAKLNEKIRREEDSIITMKEQKREAEHLLDVYGKQFTKKGESLEANRKEIALAEEAKFKYEEIILTQAGITAEKGRGLETVNQEIAKLETQKSKLGELLSAGKINTAEYQAQNEKINGQIGNLRTAKGELLLINDIAGKTVYKDVKISESPANFWNTLDRNLSRRVTKTVSIRYNNMNGPQEPGYAVGTRYAPGGMAWVGEKGPELMYVPNGARIVPNDDSQTLLNKWNIPTSSGQSSNGGSVSKSVQTSIVQHFNAAILSPSEVAKRTKQAQRQMALEWGY